LLDSVRPAPALAVPKSPAHPRARHLVSRSRPRFRPRAGAARSAWSSRKG
jgi:hypothetical protein